ncbi:proline-specific permease [Escherichia coli]|uniref:Proline-specific permease n=1 Tax=Escherichia coli TaxID=562 RepID=A0A376L104_ECOLX|nr:proline-specific permease [Escherichia coli]
MESKNKLKRGLSTRHIRFMALGSAIGTGLFYGSGRRHQNGRSERVVGLYYRWYRGVYHYACAGGNVGT